MSGTEIGRARIHELSTSECMELIRTKSVGRVAFCDHDGPVVLPVNFTIVEGDVVFLTDARNTIAWHVDQAAAAFAVDELDEVARTGWDVLVRGTGALQPPGIPPGAETLAQPWAEGVRTQLVRIRIDTISGRRLYR